MKKVCIDDFSKIYSLSELSVSPDGKTLAFVQTRADVDKNSYISTIWVMENSSCRQLTFGEKDNSPIWLDETHLLFPGDRKGTKKPAPGQQITVYNRINIHGGEAMEYFTVPIKCKKICPVNDREFLIIGVYDHYGIDLTGLSGEEKSAAIAEIEENKDYEVFDELPFWKNGSGVVNKKRDRLYLFDKETGELTLLSPEWMNVSGFDYDSVSDRVAFFGNDYQWMDDQKSDIYIKNLHGEQSVKVALEQKYSVQSVLWANDCIFFAASDGARYGTAENPCQFVANPEIGTWKQIADIDLSMRSSVSSDVRKGSGRTEKVIHGDWYYSETRGFNSVIAKLTPAGTESIVSPQASGSIDCWDHSAGIFYYIAMRNGGLQEIYSFDPNSGKECKLTSFNDDYLQTHSVVPLTPLNFVNSDGVEIDGWVMEPADYDPALSHPAILNVHGGPKTVYGEVFMHEMQWWASEGYFVFFCNPRGGDGKGNVFADISGDKYGVDDYNDLMAFTDLVLAKYPQIDPTRLGMTGGSYGGFMANWIVGHTDRFAAVASQRSISNYISKCLTTDIGYYHNLSALKCDPWTSPEKIWHHSPLKYADKCKTPTLFIQSDEDYRCWMSDAIQMFTALRMHGCPTRLCLFHGENHELSRSGKPKHRIRRLKEITDWFDTYLK